MTTESPFLGNTQSAESARWGWLTRPFTGVLVSLLLVRAALAGAADVPRLVSLDFEIVGAADAVPEIGVDGFRLDVSNGVARVKVRSEASRRLAWSYLQTRFGGVDWFTPDSGTDGSPSERLPIPEGTHLVKNPVPRRNALFAGSGTNATKEVAARCAEWNFHVGLDAPRCRGGGHIVGELVTDTPVDAQALAAEIADVKKNHLADLAKPTKAAIRLYAKWRVLARAHPDWFGLVDGARVPTGHELRVPQNLTVGKSSMPCLTNPEAIRAMAENFRRWKAKRFPNDPVYYRLCCDDQAQWCECPACARLMRPQAGENGRASDYWWTFVNAFAAQVLDDPLVHLEIFVYRTYQDFPQTVRPLAHPRLSVVLCPHGRCYLHSLNDPKCPVNPPYRAMFGRWIAAGIPINTFEYHNQTPGRSNYAFWERAWIEDVKWYARNGVSHGDGNFVGPWAGLRRQDNYYRNNAAKSRWLLMWLTARFDWDPDGDFDAVRDGALARYYRAAAEPMTAYHKLLEKAIGETGLCMPYGLSRNLFFKAASDPAVIAKARALLAEARRLATDDPETARRVAEDAAYFRTNWEYCALDTREDERTIALPSTLDDFRLLTGTGDVPMERAEKYPKKTTVRFSRDGEDLVIAIGGDPGGAFQIHYLTRAQKGEPVKVPGQYGENRIRIPSAGVIRVNVSRTDGGKSKPYGSLSGYPWFIPDYWHFIDWK